MTTPITRSASAQSRGGGVVIGRHRTRTPGSRAQAQDRPLLPGQVRCDTCGRGVGLKADGTMRAHQAERYVQCAGAPTTSATGAALDDLCAHGNFPNQRLDCCGVARHQGNPERPMPEHLRRFV